MKHLLSTQKSFKSLLITGFAGFFLIVCDSQSKTYAFDLIQNGSFEYDATFVPNIQGNRILFVTKNTDKKREI
jgi:hypothetical protein